MNLKIVSFIVVAFSFIVAGYFYTQLPDIMASHWNFRGEVDDYLPKFWGVFLMPLIGLAMLLLFLIIPKIDPLKENIKKFRKYFDGFVLLILVFFLYAYILTLLYNIGYEFNMGYFIVPGVIVIFYYAGVLTENSKKNWFIGIRTPWTLSSDKVWEKTNKLGGKMFKISALIAVLGLFLGEYGLLLIMIPPIFSGIYAVVYSYLEYKKEKK